MAVGVMMIFILLVFALSLLANFSNACSTEGIYLMLGDECIVNGTWFLDGDLQIAKGQDGYIHCVLPNETLDGGQWVRPNGLPVNCSNGATKQSKNNDIDPFKDDPFFCTDDHPDANITLYLKDDDYFQPTLGLRGGTNGINIDIETEYKCCLPTDCSDANTNIMTINVFERIYIIDIYVDLPSDITAIPQNYTVHCIVTGSFTEAIIKHNYNDSTSITELSQSYCNGNTYTGYSCTVNNTSITTYNTYGDTRDYTVTVEWEAENISNGVFTQSANNGDHVHLCTATSGAIEPKHKGRNESIIVRAPSSSPTNVIIIDVTVTSITIQWSYPNISDDVDGYVINASSFNDDYVIQQVTTSSISVTSTLTKLSPGTTYNITVRAYQDILGPPSVVVSATTLNVSNVTESSSQLFMSSSSNTTEMTSSVELSPHISDISLQPTSISEAVSPTLSSTMSLTYIDTAESSSLEELFSSFSSPTITPTAVYSEFDMLPLSTTVDLPESSSLSYNALLPSLTSAESLIDTSLRQTIDFTESLNIDSLSIETPTVILDDTIVTMTTSLNMESDSAAIFSSSMEFTSDSLSSSFMTLVSGSPDEFISMSLSLSIPIVDSSFAIFSSTASQSINETMSSSVDLVSSIDLLVSSIVVPNITSSSQTLSQSSKRQVIVSTTSTLNTSTSSTVDKSMGRGTSETSTDNGSQSSSSLLSISSTTILDTASETMFLSFTPVLSSTPSLNTPALSSSVSLDISFSSSTDIQSSSVYSSPTYTEADVTVKPSNEPVSSTSTETTTSETTITFSTETSSTGTTDTGSQLPTELPPVSSTATIDTTRSSSSQALPSISSPTKLYSSASPTTSILESTKSTSKGTALTSNDKSSYTRVASNTAIKMSYKTGITQSETTRHDHTTSTSTSETNVITSTGESDQESTSLYTIIGGVSALVLVVIILVIVILLVFIAFRRRSKYTLVSKMKYQEKNLSMEILALTENAVHHKNNRHGKDLSGSVANGSTAPDRGKESSFIKKSKKECSSNRSTTTTDITQPTTTNTCPSNDEQLQEDPAIHVYEKLQEDAGVHVNVYEKIQQDTAVYENVKEEIVIYENARQIRRQLTTTIDWKESIPKVKPVQINGLHSHILDLTQDESAACGTQFEELYKGEDKKCSIGSSQDNKMYNRFKNIIPYDENLIRLVPIPVPEHETEYNREYINASYIDGYTHKKRYIASQGPNENTVIDFWRLVWQEEVPLIVMLTNLVEMAKVKCEQYWPRQDEGAEANETYGPFTVTVTDKHIQPNSVMRVLSIKMNSSSSTSRSVMHYHFTKWPDHGVPDSASPLMKFHKTILKTIGSSSSPKPMVVHCSAGVGRTGTFITADIALEQAKKEGVVDIAGIVTRLRQQRMKMVQNQAQYLFVHQLVLESVLCGNTSIPSSQFAESLVSLHSRNEESGVTNIQKQYESLKIVMFASNSFITALENKDKNRSQENLPSERYRVLLKGAGSNYINAVFIPGFMQPKPFIIAQSPMENTAADFWRMIHNYNVVAIVTCCKEGEACCFPYWLTCEEAGYHVKTTSIADEDGLIIRNLRATIMDKNLSSEVTQFNITNWGENGKLDGHQSLLKVIEKVIKVQQKNKGGRVVVHCSDTVSRSGVYCAVSNAIEQCKVEGEIDIFQIVKSIRVNKPGAIPTLDDYVLIHKLVQKYLDEISLYHNFELKR